MKPTSFLFGMLCGATVSAIAVAVASSAGLTLDMTHHDAAGHTQHTTATLNSIIQYGTTVSVDYTSDSLFCSAFGP